MFDESCISQHTDRILYCHVIKFIDINRIKMHRCQYDKNNIIQYGSGREFEFILCWASLLTTAISTFPSWSFKRGDVCDVGPTSDWDGVSEPLGSDRLERVRRNYSWRPTTRLVSLFTYWHVLQFWTYCNDSHLWQFQSLSSGFDDVVMSSSSWLIKQIYTNLGIITKGNTRLSFKERSFLKICQTNLLKSWEKVSDWD